MAQTGVKTWLFWSIFEFGCKTIATKATVFVVLILGQNSHQVATALRMRLVRLLKRPPMRCFIV